MESLLDSRDVLVRNILALCAVLENVTHIGTCFGDVLVDRLDVTYDFSILTSTSRLLLVSVLEFTSAANCLSIVDSWVSNNEINIVFSLHPFAVNE